MLQVQTTVMDADRDGPEDYNRSGALLGASSAAKQEREPSKAASPAPSRPAVRSRRDATRDQVQTLLSPCRPFHTANASLDAERLRGSFGCILA